MAKGIHLNSLSDEQIEQLRKLGFEVKIEDVYYHDCPFCGKHIEKKNAKAALRSFNLHLGKCKLYKFVKELDNILPKGARGGDTVYVLTGEFPKGYTPESDNIEMLELIRKAYEEIEGER